MCQYFEDIKIDDYTLGGLIFAIGIAYFEVCALWVFNKLICKNDIIVRFALGLCIFDLFKFLFLMPYEVSVYDYFNVLFGVLFALIVYFKNK